MWPRDWLVWITRGAAVLAVVGVGLTSVLYLGRPNDHGVAALRQAAGQIAEASQARAAAASALDDVRTRGQSAEREAEISKSRAAAARARARIIDTDTVLVSAAPGEEATPVRVPAPVVDRMRLDSTAVATLGALLRWKNSVIVAQDRRIAADSLELVASSNAFSALQRVKQPRCGRRCGIVLGVGGMLAAAIAVEQVRRTLR